MTNNSAIIFANASPSLAPGDLWTAWNGELTVLLPLALMVLIYLWGIGTVWLRAGIGHGVSIRRCVCFLAAVAALVIALVSPLDALSGVLFWAHMVQHLILMLVVAPLLVMSDFPLALLWALPRGWARVLGGGLYHLQPLSRVWQWVSGPLMAWLLFTIVLWGWHASALFEAALRDETVHAVEHLMFITTAMLFWWVLFRHSRQAAIHYGMAVLYLFTTALQSGILGALMTFSGQPWYSYYAAFDPSWGLSPLQDQQLAGLIMWLPGGAVFTLLTILYFAAWLHSLERRSSQLHQNEQ